MKIKHLFKNPRRFIHRKLTAAFSLVEVTMGMGVIGTATVALFSGFTSGIFTMQMARENLRATQIMLEKTETLRLYSWDQIEALNPVITNQATYDPNAVAGAQGCVYNVRINIDPAPIPTSYSSEMKMVTVTLDWKSGTIDRTRSFTTYIARNGLQNYIY
jgi:type II secretory pathway pseudopilin PulG